MSMPSRLSRFFQAGFKLNKFSRLRQSSRILKLDVNFNDSANLIAGCRRLYSTEPKLSEAKLATEINAGATNTIADEQVKTTDHRDDFTLLSGLRNLDEQVKRLGRINLSQVRNLIRRCQKGMSSAEAVMLIRCCGNLLVKEVPQERKDILEQVWMKVTTCCPAITTDIANAMMSVKIENSIGFKPSEELTSLQECNCVPNKMTFDLMMSQYCETGDVLGATEVLNHMKLMDLPINLSSMHHLIKGYAKNGDFDEAIKLISTMSQHKLRPTADTYTALMVGYAEKGNLDGIKEVMTTVAAKNIVISLSNANEVVLKLAVSGHSEKVEEALDILVGGGLHKHGDQFSGRLSSHKKFDFQDTVNLLYQLLAHEKYEAIKLVLRKAVANGIIYADVISSISNNYLMTYIINKGKSPKEVLMLRDMLVEENFLNHDLEFLAECALLKQKPDYVLELFAELKDAGMFFKPHYFWPLFSKASKNKNAEEIYKITKALASLTGNSKSITDTLVDWSFKALKDLDQKTDVILSKYEELEIPEWHRDVVEIVELTKNGKFVEIRDMIENGHQISVKYILSHLNQGINESNLTDLMELIKIIQEKVSNNLKINSRFLSLAMLSFKGKSENLNNFIQSWVDNGLKFETTERIISEAKRRGVNNELLEKLSALSVPVSSLREFNSPLSKDLNLKDLPNDVKLSSKNQQSKKLQKDIFENVKHLLQKREYKEVQQIFYKLSEKGDVENLMSLKDLNMTPKLSDFFNKSLFVGHIQSGKAKEFASKAENLLKLISLSILCRLAEKEPDLFAQVEKILEKPVENMKHVSPYAALYLYYLISNNEQKINEFIQLHPVLKDKIRLSDICKQAGLKKNETLLRLVLKIHKDTKYPRQIAPAYSSLIMMKCNAKDCQAALELYNEALCNGVTFNDFNVRALQSLQAQLQGNKLPLPWKDGEVEKRAEMAPVVDNDSSSSDSESD